MKMDIAAIVIGSRHRKDYGDIAGLAASIREHGILHPVVVSPDNKLIAGERRIKAAESLGWTKIPATIVNLREIVKGERDENFARKDFTPSEAVAIADAIKPVIEEIKAEAKARQKLSPGRGKRSAKLAQVLIRDPATRLPSSLA